MPEPLRDRLREQLASARPEALRDELIAELDQGAAVNSWRLGIDADRAREQLRMHEILEGGPEATSALRTEGRFGVVEVPTAAFRYAAILPSDGRPVVVRRPPRRQAGPERPGWTFAAARRRPDFTCGIAADDSEHAVSGATTLCGLPVEEVGLVLSHFHPRRDKACPSCADEAAAAPSVPCGQERLHAIIAEAEPGPLRDDLRAALERGAEITLWISGTDLHKQYAELDQLDENRAAVEAALASGVHAGVAHVLHGPWRSTVVLRENHPPLIGRGTTT
ncbi:hypothetical protein [Dactylosporangium sp. CS-033363]|uniref:hypothetical protein n=1 Tax=Dactylosporangium sp. CS-033363 TaxID=3239935 RepID=UPI003D921883